MKEYIIELSDNDANSFSILMNVYNLRELVRCKDCKNGEPGACGYGIDCDGVWHDDDWFCADGKRA